MSKFIPKPDRAREAGKRHTEDAARIERLLREAGHVSRGLPPVNRSCDGKNK
jgi:hypothetical protein